jgi:hypothetical protein
VRKGFKNLYFRGLASLGTEMAVTIDFLVKHHRLPMLRRPQSFSEKVQHRKLFERDPRFPVLADKVSAKRYVSNILGPECIIPTLWSGPAFHLDPNVTGTVPTCLRQVTVAAKSFL